VAKLWEVREDVKKYCQELDLYIMGIDKEVTIVSKSKEIDVKHQSRECHLTMDAESDIIADMMHTSAEYYIKKGNKKAAKHIYRNIVTTFTGDSYKSQVKKAEFALEDIKDSPDTVKTAGKKGKKKPKTEE